MQTSSNTHNFDLRDRLRELDIKIMDLSELLGISRPTLYKCIELYQNNEREKIEASFLHLFDYLKTPYITKNSVIAYIVQHIIQVKTPRNEILVTDMIKNLFNPPNPMKENLIRFIMQDNRFDSVLDYLMRCCEILNKPNPTLQEKNMLKPLSKFYDSLNLDNNFLDTIIQVDNHE